ncbi:Conserved eukaryotic protein [Mycena venus]|uniref:Conserved eukaryotic protein n=1 Tax=Mycena venus TaxID=2733690 RepID=A0A8H6XSX4_9AGAR|nr:Conserved eukaryotic protein [Mycena venus]
MLGKNILESTAYPSFCCWRKRLDDDDEPEEDEDIGFDRTLDDNNIIKRVAWRGTILITLRNVGPYTQWDVPRLAKNPSPPTSGSTPPNPQYIILRSFFNRSTWKRYEHRTTRVKEPMTLKTGEGEDQSWEFCLEDSFWTTVHLHDRVDAVRNVNC